MCYVYHTPQLKSQLSSENELHFFYHFMRFISHLNLYLDLFISFYIIMFGFSCL